MCLVVAAGLVVWTYQRYFSFVGQLHTWRPPFNQFEVVTISSGLFALFLTLVGLRLLSAKKPESEKT